MAAFYAGASRVKLEPPVGIAMAGYGRRTGRSAGIHDGLAAQAVVIADGSSKGAIVTVDVLALGIRICDSIANKVAAASGIPAEAVMVCYPYPFRPDVQYFCDPVSRCRIDGDRRSRFGVGTRAAGPDRSGGYRGRLRDAAGRDSRGLRSLWTWNQPPPDARGRVDSARAQLRGRGRPRTESARYPRSGWRRESDRVSAQLCLPRRRAVRRQSSLLARLARFRDGCDRRIRRTR